MKFQVVLNLITSSCNLISSWLCSLPSIFPLQNPPDEVTSQNRISHTEENSARLEGSIPFRLAHSNTQGLGRGEPGRIQVSIPWWSHSCWCLPPSHLSSWRSYNEHKVVWPKGSADLSLWKTSPFRSVDGDFCSAASMETDGERGKMPHRPCLLLTVKIISALPSICSLPWVNRRKAVCSTETFTMKRKWGWVVIYLQMGYV